MVSGPFFVFDGGFYKSYKSNRFYRGEVLYEGGVGGW